MIYLEAKKILLLHCLCVRYVRLSCHVVPPPHMPLSPLSDPMLSCVFFFLFFFPFSFEGRVGYGQNRVFAIFLTYP